MKERVRPTSKIITLLTDFGFKDPYVGILKGVILSVVGTHDVPSTSQAVGASPSRSLRELQTSSHPWVHACPVAGRVVPSAGKATNYLANAPAFSSNSYWPGSDSGVTIVDITHDVEPQDIREGAFLIEEYYRFFPVGTIHVAIVDPTVGSTRRPIILSKDNYLFIGPDNGIFTLIMGDDPEIYLIENPGFMLREVSSTFHGRDVFAPAAACLLRGVQLSLFGKRITDPVYLNNILPVIEGASLKGEVVRFDCFGNAITNIRVDCLKDFIQEDPFEICIAGITFRSVNKSYYEDEFTCLIGSSGYLEFGHFKGSFAEMTKIGKGEQIIVERGLILKNRS